MDNFYVDIFATKGIEYIAVLTFLAALIMFWLWLNKPEFEVRAEKYLGRVNTTLVDWFLLANHYLYHQGHSWAKTENQGSVLIGIDDFAQKLLGHPDKITLPPKGTLVKQGECAWKLHFDDKSIPMLSPLNGEVIAVNENILSNPVLVNEDPYQGGWLIKVKPSNFTVDKRNLLSGALANSWLEGTVNTISERITGNFGVVLQDGGSIKTGFIRELGAEHWDELAGSYLLTSEN
jgi:glycine cleavage system H lipoate-binding protein